MRHNLRRGIHRGESSPRPAGWGTQPLRIQLRVCSRSNFRASLFTCRPSGALGYLVYAACYKHVAPLGLNAANAAQFAARIPSWGRGFLVQRVGEPNPYGSSFACSRSNFRASRFTCRPSGALGYLVYCVCYKHVAPLGLNAPMSHLTPRPNGNTCL